MAGGRRFELQRQLGEGSFGTVYLADMVSLGGFRKTVALKVLAQRWSTESDAARRLRDEARLLGRLEHRNIVRVYDLVRVDGRWAVVMEAVRGADLEQVVHAASATGSPAPLRAALEAVRGIAVALHAALHGSHGLAGELRVVHRDIKPSNVILTADGEVKVLDFGIARADLDEREAKTSSIGFGSIPYMGPERLRGEEATAAGDVYSLGAVLYELLVGVPYGRSELGEARAQTQWEERRRLFRAAVGTGEVPDATEALIAEMMAWDPDLRPDVTRVAARLDGLGRAAPGESLVEWASLVVPVALRRAQSGEHQISGVLSEEESGPAGSRSSGDRVLGPPVPRADGGPDGQQQPPPSAPTLVASDVAVPLAPTPLAPPAGPPAAPTMTLDDVPPARSRRPWGIALGAALGLGLAALGAWAVLSGGEPGPGAPPVASAAQVPPAAPEAQPSPPPAPVVAPEDPPAEAPAPAVPPPDPIPPGPSPATTAARTTSAAARGTAPPAPQPEAPEAAAPPPAPEAAPTAAASVRMVKVVVPGASRVSARCGDRTGSGTTSLVVRDLPAGTCQVTAEIDGVEARGSLRATESHAFSCAAAGDALECR